ncbi:menaquinone-dependent protoporphyrinogen IX dehydrogenase [Candidatus Pantoea edessiphila]|uniref:Protoporphyrinogen IX dehydrogenase [quinone] n=1 Tax=Candidatus Pantoea edessiphila TaxID=2044610 RepID=A0A2P5SXE2_9GAMM|nr:menaquinone-dependent protoporphyrinogen IX dehydrogenase [Candidatus Pantoea edessiphila]MBK4775930.1 menaquinone-dependent protoporphyrinogen IX dehydrogenase [Pantoea sp. Edef]PPI86994.1 menaquinone-dependent protoporphyrinogen IX dehydrogenase [Candidatus Pantoea edessiphila]
MKALIIFYSRNGQTKKISSYIADNIRMKQICDVINITDAISRDLDWKAYDRVLIGASIYYGNFNPIVYKFIQQNIFILKTLITGFFAVNLTARKIGKNSPVTNSYTKKFLKNSPWKPNCCAVFAGSLQYSNYNWFNKNIIKFIMYLTGGETNHKCDIEYTDWEQVKNFVNYFKELKSNLI